MRKSIILVILIFLFILPFNAVGQSVKLLRIEYPVYSFVVEMPGYSKIACWESVRSYLQYIWNRDISNIKPGNSYIAYDFSTLYTETDSGVVKVKASIQHDIDFEFKEGRFKYSIICREIQIETNTEGKLRDEILYEWSKLTGRDIIKIYYSIDEW